MVKYAMTMASSFEKTVVPFDSSAPSGVSERAVDSRIGKPLFHGEEDDALVLSSAQNFEASDWLRDANAAATRRWNLLVLAHHSFADPFWEKERERILARRSALMANSMEHGFPTSSAVEYKSLGTLLYHIDSAVAEYRGRDLMFSGMIKSLRDGIDRSSTPENRRSRTVEMYLLLGALRNKNADIVVLVQELTRMSNDPNISQSRREQIQRHIERVGFPFSVPNIAAEDLVLQAADTDTDSDTEKDGGPTIIPSEDLKPIQFAPEGVVKPSVPREEEDAQNVADRERLVKSEEEGLLGFLTITRSVIEGELRKKPSLLTAVDLTDGLEDQLGDQLSEIVAYANDYPGAHVDAGRYRFMAFDELLPFVARDIAEISAASGERGQADYLGSSFIEVAKEFLKTRLRYEMWREYLIQESAHTMLGVSRVTDRRSIEQAFAAQMQTLDFDRAADRRQIADLQQARERLLIRAEAREKEEAPRRAEEKRGAQENADRAHYAWMTKPIDKPVAPEVVLPNNTEGWWSRALRSPGAKIRAALFGAVAVGAGALALHEFGENDTDPSHVVVGALEDPKIDDGSAESFGVDLEGDKDTEGRGPVMAQRIEERNVDHVTASKDTLWKVLSDRIRARGLRPTHEKIMTLKHFADLENPGVDWETLQVGQVIHLKQVEGMLDEMEGKPVVAPLPDAGFRSVLTGEPESVLENIPASTFEQAVAQLQQKHAEEQARWYSELSAADHEPIAAKAYEDIPREGHTNHVMAKGEWIYKLIHLMLRDSGLNWSTPRITKLKNMTLQENGLSEEQAKKIPVGATITFDSAVREIQAMKAAKEKGKKK